MSEPRRSGAWASFTASVYDDVRLTPAARDVLGLLSAYAGPDGSCWPHVATLAARLGVKRQAVSKQLKRLAACGYITIERRHGPKTGWQIASLYTLADEVEVPPRYRRPEQRQVALAGPEQPQVARPEQPQVAGQSNLERTPVTYPLERIHNRTEIDRGRRNGVAVSDAPGERVLPPTEADRELWDLAWRAATEGWARGPAEDVAELELLGRDKHGGLVLRGRAGMARFTRHLAVALSAAGDPAGARVRIVEGGP